MQLLSVSKYSVGDFLLMLFPVSNWSRRLFEANLPLDISSMWRQAIALDIGLGRLQRSRDCNI